METATISTSANPTHANIWKTQKRGSEADFEHKDGELISTASINETSSQQIKRFKGDIKTSLQDRCIEPVDVGALTQPRKLLLSKIARFQDRKDYVLSPITEISQNLWTTTLDTPCKDSVEVEHINDDGDSTTFKNRQFLCDSAYNLKQKQHKNIGDKTKSPSILISEEQNSNNQNLQDKSNDMCILMETPTNSQPPVRTTSRRLMMENSLHEMAVDGELSFFDDDTALLQEQQRSLTASPELMGLLSPESSPRRFKIIEKLENTHSPDGQRKLKDATNSKNVAKSSAEGFRMFHSLSSSSMESTMDDEYLELYEMESLGQQISRTNLNFPSGLNSLISGQIKSDNSVAVTKTPAVRRSSSVRRCLSMTENNHQSKTPELRKHIQETTTPNSSTTFSRAIVERNASSTTPVSNYCFKRPEPPSNISSPIQTKRCRGDEKENVDTFYVKHSSASTITTTTSPQIARPPLRKCMSMNDAEIMTALARSECTDEPDLIGDFSKPFVLPLMEGRHRDLKSISSDTVARLIRGDFADQVASYRIIDCRYPYEYDGGHIRGAKNLYTQEQIIEEFLTQIKTEQQQEATSASASADGKRHIIIFHCEFSSERGPKLSRFLRNNDRARNTNSYPALEYPEIYLLHNGYKDFYETHADLCDPVSYRPMLEPSYSEAYRHFRAKSKSWNGDGGLGGATSRLKKSRSRLML